MRKVQHVCPRSRLPFVRHAEHGRNLAEPRAQTVQVPAKAGKKRPFVMAITILPERPTRPRVVRAATVEVHNEKACNRNPGGGGSRTVGAGKRAGCVDRRGSGRCRSRRWPGLLRLLRRL